MYQYVSALLCKVGLNHFFEPVNISLLTTQQIATRFKEGYIVLTNPQLTSPLYVNFKDLLHGVMPLNDQTFERWLMGMVPNSIPASVNEPVLTENHVYFMDAFQTGCAVQRLDPNDNTLDTTGKPPEDLTDCYITKPHITLDALTHHSLVSINGLLHNYAPAFQGIQVRDATKSLNKTGNISIGLWSFNSVGRVDMYAITEAMLSKNNPAIDYVDETLILLGQDITNKSVILSMGGYPIICSSMVKVVNPVIGLIRVSFEHFNLVEAVLNSVDLIDLTPLELTRWNGTDGVYSISEINSDAVIVRYLTKLSNSFIAVIDTPSLYIRKEKLSTEVPTILQTFTQPETPLMDQYGRVPEYWFHATSNPLVTIWNMNIVPRQAGRRLSSTQRNGEYDLVQGGWEAATVRQAKMYQLGVGNETLTFS